MKPREAAAAAAKAWAPLVFRRSFRACRVQGKLVNGVQERAGARVLDPRYGPTATQQDTRCPGPQVQLGDGATAEGSDRPAARTRAGRAAGALVAAARGSRAPWWPSWAP